MWTEGKNEAVIYKKAILQSINFSIYKSILLLKAVKIYTWHNEKLGRNERRQYIFKVNN